MNVDKNIIFYFTGTGNSLKAARDIAQTLGNCELVSMAKPYLLNGAYGRIGFVYPNYYMGLPVAVKRFITNLDIGENKGAYFFGVCTSGGATAGGLNAIASILAGKGGKLSYGINIKCFSNYVCLYQMSKKVEEKVASQARSVEQAAAEIQNNTVKKIPRDSWLAFLSGGFEKSVAARDKNYNINDSCNGCGICVKVCPVDNIKMENGNPDFLHHCEQCVACIQWCPKQAVNYKNKTQNRRRYHHPDITVADMAGE